MKPAIRRTPDGSKSQSPLAKAKGYALLGLRVFPIHSVIDGRCTCGQSDCTKPGKHPRSQGWQESSTADPKVASRLAGEVGPSNLAIHTGKESGIIVLDLDAKHGGMANLTRLEATHGTLPKTPMALSGGGGVHYYFAHPGTRVACRANIGRSLLEEDHTGIDVRGDGGYIIAPPSRHASGRAYTWKQSPQDTPFAVAPPWLLALMNETGGSTKPSKGTPSTTVGSDHESRLPLAAIWPIESHCEFIRHAKKDAADLSEAEWWSLASILARVRKGKAHFLDWSKAYPGFSRREALAKFTEAQAKKPHTCDHIGQKFAGCQSCPFGRQTQYRSSPITIGTPGSIEYAAWVVDRALVKVTKAGTADSLLTPRTVDALARLSKLEYAKAKARVDAALPNWGGRRDLDRAVDEARATALEVRAHTSTDGRPVVVVQTPAGRGLDEVSNETVAALVKANKPPRFFIRGQHLVRLRPDGEDGRWVIEDLSQSALRGELARVCDFRKLRDDGVVTVSPPMEVVSDLLSLSSLPFPQIDGIAESPVMRADGTILDTPGYDAATKLFYAPHAEATFDPVPDSPSRKEVARAKQLIEDIFCDFPFADTASLPHVLALLLSVVVRPAINGPTPMALITAPREGTGKDLLVDCVSIITTGRRSASMTMPRGEDEWRKQITARLMTGTTIIHLNNVPRGWPLDSATLAAALTTTTWSDRRLGGNTENLLVPNRAVWLATGNNITFAGDMQRRGYRIAIDANESQPWRRKDFKYTNLLEHVQQHRGELLRALLMLARAWFAAGKPEPKTEKLGSFESWSTVIGGILEQARVQNFLGNLAQLYAEDEETVQWGNFLAVWHEQFKGKAITMPTLCATLDAEGSELLPVLPDHLAEARDAGRGSFNKKLGHALKRQKDRVFGAYRLMRGDLERVSNTRLWYVMLAEAHRKAKGQA